MGVYHLMGLGRSAGAITGPLSYLAHRYQRWNSEDQRFFARSGEVSRRARDEKVGDVQALVLFTTPEVLGGEVSAFDYVVNPPGQATDGPLEKDGPMKEALKELLRREWPPISGERRTATIFWCEVDRRDIRSTYDRAIRVITALAGVGGQGKEMWVNLTGGNNVINFALELAATLSGDVARLYYVQAENPQAEKCVRFTAEKGYWVELPVMPLALGHLSRAIIDLLSSSPLPLSDLYSRLRNEYWDLSRGLTSEALLRTEYLEPLWKQGLIADTPDGYIVGPQWELIQPYEEVLQHARRTHMALERLAGRETWIQREELTW